MREMETASQDVVKWRSTFLLEAPLADPSMKQQLIQQITMAEQTLKDAERDYMAAIEVA